MLKGYVETDRCPYPCNGTARTKAFAQHKDYSSIGNRDVRMHIGVPEHGLCIEMYMETLDGGEPVACSAGIYSIGLGLLTVSTPTVKNGHDYPECGNGFMDFFRAARALGHKPRKMTIVAPGVVERMIPSDGP